MSQISKFILKKSNVSPLEYITLEAYFYHLQTQPSITDYIELVDVNKYQITRNKNLIKRFLLRRDKSPFMFINCLN